MGYKFKKIKKFSKKILKFSFAFLMVFSLVYTPSSPINKNNIAKAAVTNNVYVLNYTQTILTEGTSWTVPWDWVNGTNTIEVIGGGGAGFTDTTGIAGMGGGGGGAYSKITNLSLTAGAVVTYQIGVGGKNNAATGGAPNGTDTFFNRTAGSAGTCADTTSVCAKGGLGATNATGAAGGASASGTGTTKWSGGAGGTGNATADSGGGGGGAGGPSVDGKVGGAGYTVGTGGGGGGGGGNGGSSSAVGAAGTTTGGAGGNGDLGTGGGTGGSAASGGSGTTSGAGGGGGDGSLHGGHGANGTNLSGGVGPGGGGGGGGGTSTTVGVGGNGGLYGGGGGGTRYGGKGAPGVIVITYGGSTASRTSWTVPEDWNSASNSIEVFGAGGSSFSAAQGSGTGGGGGGGYSKITNLALTPKATVTYQIGQGGRKTVVGVGAGVNGGDTFFNRTSGSAGTCADTTSVCAKGGLGATSLTGAAGGASASGTGTTKFSGGAGGTGNGTGDSGGGGGGAGGFTQNGFAGGIGYTSASGGGGGGGGAGDNSGANSTVGGAGVAANGGAGGQGPLGTGSGTAGANTFGGDATTSGAGGGGGDTPFAGGEGSDGVLSSSAVYGGGGGGGVGDNNSVATGALFGGDGGFPAGGGGAGLVSGFGRNGAVVVTYLPYCMAVSTGNWSDTSIWRHCGDADSGAIPTSADTNVIIRTGVTVTLTADTAAIGNLIINGTLTTGTNFTINASTIDINTGGTLTANNSAINLSGTSGTLFTNDGTFTPGGSTVNLTSASGGATINSAATTFNNLTLSNTSGNFTAGADLTVNTTLTTTSGGTLAMSTFQLLGDGTFAVTNNGTVTTSNTTNPALPAGGTWTGTTGAVTFGLASGGQSIPAGTYKTLTLSNSSGTNTAVGALSISTSLVTTSGGTLDMGTNQLSGAFAPTNNGAITTTNTSNPAIPTGQTWSGTTGTVTFAATGGGQFIPAGTYKTVTFSNTSGTDTAVGALSISTSLVTTSGGTLDMGTNQLSGAFTPTNNGTITTASTADPAIPTGLTWTGTTGQVTFSATAGGQFVPAGTYNGLTFSNTSGTDTARGNLTVTTLTTTAGGTLDMATFTLGVTNVTNNGIINTQNTSGAPVTTGKTWAGTVNYNAATGGQTVMTGTYNNLTLGNTSGTSTASNTLTVNTTLTTTSGGTLAMSTFQLLGDGSFAVTNNGTVTTSNTTNPAIPAGGDWTGTTGAVTFGVAAGGQSIPAGTYKTLTFSNTSGTNTAVGALVVNGTMTTTSGGTLAMGANQLSGTTTPVNNGAITTSSTANPAISSGGNWEGTTGSVTFAVTSGGQFVPAGTYKTLTFSNTSGTDTAVGALVVNGVMTTTSGGTLAMGTNQLSGTITPANSGTITTTSTANPAITTGKNWGGGGGLVIFAATTGGQFIPAGTYPDLTFSNTSGTNTILGAIVTEGTLTTTSGGTLDMGSFAHTVDAFTNGGIVTPSAGSLTISGATFTNNGTFTASGTHTFAFSTIASPVDVNGTNTTTFNNFSVTGIGAAKTVRFKHHTTNVPLYNFAGTFTITGASGQIVSITSDDGANKWLADFATAQPSSVTYANISWSGCLTSANVTLDATSTDGLNNDSCWVFPVASITVGGNAYEDDASTALASCPSTISVRFSGTTYSGSCTGGTGVISAITTAPPPAAGTPIFIWVDDATDCGGNNANSCATTVIDYSGSGNITDAVIRRNRLIIRHDDAGPVDNIDLNVYDNSGDTDLVYDVDASNNLVVEDNIKLVVNGSDTFTPGALVTTSPSASAGTVDGDISVLGTLALGTNALSVGGDFSNAGVVTYSGGQTTTFTATATGHTIEDGTNNFDTLVFNGSGGIWTFSSALTTVGNVTITTGTITTSGNALTVGGNLAVNGTLSGSGAGTITVNGDLTGTGVINVSGNTVEQRIGAAKNFGQTSGSNNWIFNNLTFSNSATDTSLTVTTQTGGSGTITVAGSLLIGKSGDDSTGAGSPTTLDAGDVTWILSATDNATPFVILSSPQGVLSGSTSDFQYTGNKSAGDVTIATSTGYNNLTLGGGSAENYTIGFSTVTLSGDLVMNTNGTLIGTGNMTVNGGGVTGDGDINLTGGSFVVNTAGDFGGATNWDFSSLTIGAAGNAITTAIGAGSITVASVLTIDTGDTLDSKGKTWTLSGTTGAPFVISGTLDDTANTGTFSFTGTSAGDTTIPASTAYNNISLGGGSAENYTIGAGTVTLSGNLLVNANGTLIGTGNLTVNGDATGAGTINLTGGTFEQRIASAKNFGQSAGSNTWTFNNLTFSNSATDTALTITTLTAVFPDIAVTGNLLIGKSGDDATGPGSPTTLAAGNRFWILSGTGGSPLTILSSPQGVLSGQTSLFRYTGNNTGGDTTIATASYGSLVLNNGSETFVTTGTVNVSENLTITAGIFTPSAAVNVTGLLTVDGTLSGTQNITVNAEVYGTGTINLTGGTFEQRVGASRDFGATSGSIGWTFNNLTFSRSAGTPTITTQTGGSGTITITGTLLVSKSSDSPGITLDAGNRIWILNNTNLADPFDMDQAGGSLTGNTSTFRFDGDNDAGSITVENATYNNLTVGGTADAIAETYVLEGSTSASGVVTIGNASSTQVDVLDGSSHTLTLSAGSGTPFVITSQGSFTASTSTVAYTGTSNVTATIYNNLTLGGTGTYTMPATTLTLRGNLSIPSGPTVTKGAGTILFAKGTTGQTWTDSTASKQDLGTVQVSDNGGATTLGLGSNVKATVMIVDGSQIFVPGANTLNILGSGTAGSRPFRNSGTFTNTNSTIVYAGDGDTDIEAGGTTYNNLTFSPTVTTTGKTYTANGVLTVAGNLDINPTAGSALNLGVVLGGNSTVTGTLTIQKTSSATSSLSTSGSNFSLGAGKMNIATGGTLTANNSTITITGSGTAGSRPFIATGAFTIGGSTLAYTGTSATEIESTTYNHLHLIPAGTPIYTLGTAGSQTINVEGDMTIGNGANGVQIQHATWDPALNIKGNLLIATSAGTFTKSDLPATITLKPTGSKTWTDNTNQDVGTVVIGSGSTTPKISLSSNVKATSVNLNSAHEFDMLTRTLTLTGSGAAGARPFIIAGTFTPSSGTVAYTGTAASEIESTTYNHLSLIPAGTPVYTLGTAGSQTINTNDFTIGDGANAVAVNHATYDPAINIAGNFVLATSVGTFTKSDAGTPAVITFKPVGTKTWTDNTNQDIGTVTIGSGTSTPKITPSTNIKATSLTIDASHEFDMLTRTLVLTGNGATIFTPTGTFTPNAGTVEFAAGTTTGTTVPATTYNNLTINRASNTFTVPSGTLNVGGILNVNAGILDLNASDPTTTITGNVQITGTLTSPSSTNLTFRGNWTNDGTHNPSGGTVVANPTGSTVTVTGTGTKTFNNFTANLPGKTIKFKHGSGGTDHTTFEGLLSLSGSLNSFLNIESTSASTQWLTNIASSGSSSIAYSNIKDSGCYSGTKTVSVDIHSNNFGNNNTCWGFASHGGGGGGDTSGGGVGKSGGGAGGGGAGEGGGGGGGGGQQGGGQGGGGGGGGGAP